MSGKDADSAKERLQRALNSLAPEEIPPGADVNKNIEAAQAMSGNEYVDKVKSNGSWDYKRIDPKFENFGNFNFGATCTAAGGTDALCRIGAGGYQIKSNTSKLEYWRSNFDDPKDQFWITRGQRYYSEYQSVFMWNYTPRKKR